MLYFISCYRNVYDFSKTLFFQNLSALLILNFHSLYFLMQALSKTISILNLIIYPLKMDYHRVRQTVFSRIHAEYYGSELKTGLTNMMAIPSRYINLNRMISLV